MDSLQFQLEMIDRLTKPAKEMAAQLSALQSQLKKTDQASKKVDGFFKSMGNAISKTAPLLKGFAAIYAAEIGAIVGGAALSIHASEMKNDTLDALEAFLGTAEAAQQTYAKINDITGRVAISQSRGTELARELSAAGITNADALTQSIESIGMVESVLGSGAGSKIQGIIEKSLAGGKFEINTKSLSGTGLQSSAIASALGMTPDQLKKQMAAGKITAEQGIAALTKAINSKFAGAAGKQVLDFGAQLTRLKDNFVKLFEDVDTDGFLKSMKDILAVFDQATPSGQALKFILTSTFNGLFKVVEAIAPFVKTFLKGLVIIALQIYIAFKPLIKTISEAFGGDQSEKVNTMAVMMSKLAAAIGAAVSYMVMFAVAGVKVFEWFVEVETYLISLPQKFYDGGVALVTGLVNGIKSGASAVVGTVKDTATSALKAFTGFFEVGSPSKVMERMGGHLMSGLEQGIDNGAGGAQESMTTAVAPPKVGGAGGGGDRSVTVTVAPGAIVISGMKDAQQVADLLPEMLANVFESAMIEQGSAA